MDAGYGCFFRLHDIHCSVITEVEVDPVLAVAALRPVNNFEELEFFQSFRRKLSTYTAIVIIILLEAVVSDAWLLLARWPCAIFIRYAGGFLGGLVVGL